MATDDERAAPGEIGNGSKGRCALNEPFNSGPSTPAQWIPIGIAAEPVFDKLRLKLVYEQLEIWRDDLRQRIKDRKRIFLTRDCSVPARDLEVELMRLRLAVWLARGGR